MDGATLDGDAEMLSRDGALRGCETADAGEAMETGEEALEYPGEERLETAGAGRVSSQPK